ncbi:DUF423 domain-containing protein [Prosthecodimorpha staleyi]|uniref:DUF423 domain-containing protein n=1 Tax=Prosthecodimorpha staleyi TaxID=2840188 RepID=A0A947D4W1_9HYPH|nr:DUF423 domain-containing protein [Prosthecodimorpha staleyi]MBT9290881.1 DUF423 domain-containing protein [Prosthecodimorpha staleyi]
MPPIARLHLLLAGLLGATGVALAAAASHLAARTLAGGDAAAGAGLGPASLLLVAHGAGLAALAALGMAVRSRMIGLAGIVLAAGSLLFAGDLALRAFQGARLFANAAPIGGSTMIAGWLLVALGALLARRPAA